MNGRTDAGRISGRGRPHGPSPLEYRLYYAAIYAAALPVSLARWARGLARGKPRSLFGEARAITLTVLPFVFMTT